MFELHHLINILMMWIKRNIVLLDIYYYMPDHTNLVQEFIWQTEDTTPNLPRVHKFLGYWKENIDATIQQILISIDGKAAYRNVDVEKYLN